MVSWPFSIYSVHLGLYAPGEDDVERIFPLFR